MVKKKIDRVKRASQGWFNGQKLWYKRTVNEHLSNLASKTLPQIPVSAAKAKLADEYNGEMYDATAAIEYISSVRDMFPKGSDVAMKLTEAMKICDQTVQFMRKNYRD